MKILLILVFIFFTFVLVIILFPKKILNFLLRILFKNREKQEPDKKVFFETKKNTNNNNYSDFEEL